MISRVHPRALAAAIAAAGLFGAAPVLAQEAVNVRVERFELSLDREGIIGTEWAAVPKHLHWDMGVWMGFANDPLHTNPDGTTARDNLVTQRIGGSLVGSIALFDWVQLGMSLPVVMGQTIESGTGVDDDEENVKDLGSPRLSLKVRILNQPDHGVYLAFMGTALIPVGRAEDAMGDSEVVFTPSALVSRTWGAFRGTANLGYRFRDGDAMLASTISAEDELYGSLGAAYRMSDAGGPPIEIDLTATTSAHADDPFSGDGQINTEFMGGLRYGIDGAATAMLGAGVGLNDAYATPDWRVVFAFRFGVDSTPPPPPTIKVVPVVAGRGMNATGDADKDLVVDGRDLCPGEAEDVDGYEDNDGCPDLDNDNDGVMDNADACPDTRGIVENRGCADADRDQDRVVDRIDNCPDTVGPAANRGCPMDRTQLAFLTDARLEVANNVFFEKSTAKIDARSLPLLDNVAEILVAHPEIAVIEVQGHVDELESREKNLKLSQQRADAVVNYLAKKGVDRSRLRAVGAGSDHPLVSPDDPKAKELNRRVEFHLADVEDELDAGLQQPATKP